MIRAIDLGYQLDDEERYFALFDTVRDRFIELDGACAWCGVADLRADLQCVNTLPDGWPARMVHAAEAWEERVKRRTGKGWMNAAGRGRVLDVLDEIAGGWRSAPEIADKWRTTKSTVRDGVAAARACGLIVGEIGPPRNRMHFRLTPEGEQWRQAMTEVLRIEIAARKAAEQRGEP